MPWSDVGEQRLHDALRDVDACLVEPLTVWWFDGESAQEQRGTLHGWRTIDGDRRGLVVARGYRGRRLFEVPLWVPEHLVRERRE